MRARERDAPVVLNQRKVYGIEIESRVEVLEEIRHAGDLVDRVKSSSPCTAPRRTEGFAKHESAQGRPRRQHATLTPRPALLEE